LDDSPAESRQPCELCHRQPIDGDRYRFYYGKKTDTSFIGFLLALRRTGSPPLITERESAWICRKCVKRRTFLRFGLQALLLLTSLALLANTFIGGPSSPLLPALGLMALGILILTFPPRGEKEIGEQLAVRIKKKALRRQGYNVFLTSKQFAKLR
jgi:hypothetical protein